MRTVTLTRRATLNVYLVVFTICLGVSSLGYGEPQDRIVEKIGLSRGICVILGDVTGEVTSRLAGDTELQLYVQLEHAEQVAQLRRRMDAAGLLGRRVWVEQGGLSRVHLADDLADALIAVNGATEIARAEALRVVRPQGKALVGDQVWTKPFPPGIDDWSHPYHGPDNNPQSLDRVGKAPYLTQFLAEPYYAPLTQIAVASAGRVFKAFGHVAFHEREEPFLSKLVAFNGYNGTILWKRDITPGIMVHRNTMIATPEVLYYGDDRSCKMIDTRTGRVLDEIMPPEDIAGGTYWKWMGLEEGILYAVVGEKEFQDQQSRWRRTVHGWPWNQISKGFNLQNHAWGFGRNVMAIDPKSKRILWHYHEKEPIDTRAVCMKNGRIYLFRFGAYLTALNAKNGKVLWRKTPENAPRLFATLGKDQNRQGANSQWRVACYTKCSDEAIYFAGPQLDKLVAVSTRDGRVLWQHEHGNFQLVLREEGLYCLSGNRDQQVSLRLNPLTGETLAEIQTAKRGCTRPNGSVDSILYRALGGSTRLAVDQEKPMYISPMRPECQDGVTIANGLLYWWPMSCDCQLNIYGVASLGPAKDFDFYATATEKERLQAGPAYSKKFPSTAASPADWPTFRANNLAMATNQAIVPEKSQKQWHRMSQVAVRPTAATVVDGRVYLGGSDGTVHCLDASTGEERWRAYTGGSIRISPTIWQGRVFVGSGDGWAYAFDAASGELIWRFRAAPIERKIPVYGALMSTWPAASGVIIDRGVAYVAAGISNYDGTYVYALDAKTGHIRWQNNSSGHLDPEAKTGASVQGHFLIHEDTLYLAGGNGLSPARYALADGRCLNDPTLLRSVVRNNILSSQSPRGWELYLMGEEVVACGPSFYGDPKWEEYDNTVAVRTLMTRSGDRHVAWVDKKKVICYPPIDKNSLTQLVTKRTRKNDRHILPQWGSFKLSEDPLWQIACPDSVAVAVTSNAVLVAGRSALTCLDLADGKQLWSQPLPMAPVPWGVAVDRRGRVVVTLKDGQVLCFGEARGT
ncbi:MAG: PQQ-binding-like beta-propeller repeat protein [Planctomycetes bacterium]|nr:PQQ-binding-like beta-propeller repeat protein [Planctomycetota bacterium]